MTSTETRMCPECGMAFEPKNAIQVFCQTLCRNRWYEGKPKNEAFPRAAACERTGCGKTFQQRTEWHRFCCPTCKNSEHWARLPKDHPRRDRSRAKCKAWYQANREKHIANSVRRKREKNGVTAKIVSPKPAAETDTWLMPAPELAYLPGGAFTLDLRPRFKFAHDQISALHGMLTAITGPHRPNCPVFSLIPWPCSSGWACYIGDTELARLIANKVHEVSFDGAPAGLWCGPLVRIKAPCVEPGEHILSVEALTPVHIRADAGQLVRTKPTSQHLRGTLEGFLPRRLGVSVPPGTVALELLEDNTRQESVRLRGNGQKLGGMPGWVGSVKVKTNAPGRWLLECAALGLGYGGKVAFGFGRVRVRAENG